MHPPRGVGGLEERARDRVRVFGAPSCPIEIGYGSEQKRDYSNNFKSSFIQVECPGERELYISIFISFNIYPVFSPSLRVSRARVFVYVYTGYLTLEIIRI